MSNRFMAAALLAAVSAVGQTTVGPTKSYVVPRTADGQPDISGVYSNVTNIPLERPQNLGAKEFFTPEEAAARAAGRGGGGRGGAAAADRAGTPADVHYDVSQFGLDRSHAVVATSLRTSQVTGPEGRIPPLLPEAQKRQADRAALNRGHQYDGPENRGLAERCLTWGNVGPPITSPGYNSDLQIVQGPGYVAIMQEMIHDVRVIPTDGRPHLPASIKQWFGDSRGRWEGDTLVVDTTNFSDKAAFRGSGEDLHVVERFTRVDAETVRYEFTVDAPKTWAKPWSAEAPFAKIASPIFEYACQEGNYGMPNILSGARASEAAQKK